MIWTDVEIPSRGNIEKLDFQHWIGGLQECENSIDAFLFCRTNAMMCMGCKSTGLERELKAKVEKPRIGCFTKNLF